MPGNLLIDLLRAPRRLDLEDDQYDDWTATLPNLIAKRYNERYTTNVLYQYSGYDNGARLFEHAVRMAAAQTISLEEALLLRSTGE